MLDAVREKLSTYFVSGDVHPQIKNGAVGALVIGCLVGAGKWVAHRERVAIGREWQLILTEEQKSASIFAQFSRWMSSCIRYSGSKEEIQQLLKKAITVLNQGKASLDCNAIDALLSSVTIAGKKLTNPNYEGHANRLGAKLLGFLLSDEALQKQLGAPKLDSKVKTKVLNEFNKRYQDLYGSSSMRGPVGIVEAVAHAFFYGTDPRLIRNEREQIVTNRLISLLFC